VFGSDARERMAEETQGLGYVRERDGELWQRDRSGEPRRISPDAVIDQFSEEIE
jgi:hypothetical protein